MRQFVHANLELNNIYEITPELLKCRGISNVISDLDNTIADYDTFVPTAEMTAWIKGLQVAGIGFAIVSNNCRDRVREFCSELKIPYYWRSAKPLQIQIWRAMRRLRAKRKTTCLIGDKYSTDILGAKLAGLFSIHVPSIKPRRKGVGK